MKTYVLTSVLVYFILISCKTEPSLPQEETPLSTQQENNLIAVSTSQFEKNDMKLEKVYFRKIPKTIVTTGYIDVPPENRYIVSPPLGGYITFNPLLVGDVVKEGQRLLGLENPEYVKIQQEFLETREELNFLREEYLRQQELLKENITSRKNFMRSETLYRVKEARYHSLKAQLQLLNINPENLSTANISREISLYTPIAGSISEVYANKGSYVSPDNPVMEIVNTDHIHLELNVFERDIMKVKKGQRILFTIPESTDRTFEGEVILISRALDKDRRVRVHGDIGVKESHQFIVGMFAEAEIVVDDQAETDLMPTVQESAIIESEGAYYLLRVTKRDASKIQLERIRVRKGITRNGMTVIKGVTLNENDSVLVRGAFDLIQ